jgi:hypothetical protein
VIATRDTVRTTQRTTVENLVENSREARRWCACTWRHGDDQWGELFKSMRRHKVDIRMVTESG